MPYRILRIIFILLCATSIVHAQTAPNLVVAWVENGGLLVWRTGDAAPAHYPSVIASQPLISSDGQYIAFYSAAPSSLWLVTPTDTNPIEVVPNQALAASDTQYLNIGNLQRGANDTFYFNTYLQPTRITLQTNDIWAVDAAAKIFKQLSPSLQTGYFNLSPDGQHMVLTQSGLYNTTDGKIGLVDKDGQSRQDILSFPAVSTASDYDFYPQPFWESSNTAFNIAIPDKDLVYHDDTALTTLWHITTDGTKTQRGTLQATFFGLPQWSDNGAYITYLRHRGDVTTNQFELMIASGDGSNPVAYASGLAGTIGLPQWLPNSDQFIYSQGEPGDYWLGQPGHPPQALPGKIFNPNFVDSTTYVFATAPGDTFEIRYAQLGDTASTLIAAVSNTIALFDAVLVP